MQDRACGGQTWEPVKQHYAAQLRGVAYNLRLYVRDECMEATVEAHNRGALPKTALATAVVLIVSALTLELSFQVAVIVMGALCLLSAWAYCRTVAQETIRVLPDVGIVLISTSAVGFKLCRFLAWEHAGPMIINEHVTTVAVSSYLAVLDVQEKKLLPVFNNLRPPLKLIQHVYRATMVLKCKRLSGDGLDWKQWSAAL